MNSYTNGDTFSPEPRSLDVVTSVIEVEQFARGAMRYGGRVGPYFVALSPDMLQVESSDQAIVIMVLGGDVIPKAIDCAIALADLGDIATVYRWAKAGVVRFRYDDRWSGWQTISVFNVREPNRRFTVSHRNGVWVTTGWMARDGVTGMWKREGAPLANTA